VGQRQKDTALVLRNCFEDRVLFFDAENARLVFVRKCEKKRYPRAKKARTINAKTAAFIRIALLAESRSFHPGSYFFLCHPVGERWCDEIIRPQAKASAKE